MLEEPSHACLALPVNTKERERERVSFSACLYILKVSPCQVSKLLLYGVRTLNWVKRLHSELSSVVLGLVLLVVVKQFAYARRAFKTIGAKQLQRGMARGGIKRVQREREEEETPRLFAAN